MDEAQTRHHLQQAEDDLREKITQLERYIDAKLDGPRALIRRIEKAIAWTRAHPRIAIAAAFAAVALLVALKRLTSPRMT
jgi:hypothetical protein